MFTFRPRDIIFKYHMIRCALSVLLYDQLQNFFIKNNRPNKGNRFLSYVICYKTTPMQCSPLHVPLHSTSCNTVR